MSVAARAEVPGSGKTGLMVLVLSYPLLSHFSAVLGLPLLQWLALVVLCAVPITDIVVGNVASALLLARA